MTITGAIVLFAVIWFMALLVALPLRLTTQQEAGEIEPGTPASAPTNPDVKRKMFWVTIVTIVLWIPLILLISSGWINVADLDFWGRLDAN